MFIYWSCFVWKNKVIICNLYSTLLIILKKWKIPSKTKYHYNKMPLLNQIEWGNNWFQIVSASRETFKYRLKYNNPKNNPQANVIIYAVKLKLLLYHCGVMCGSQSSAEADEENNKNIKKNNCKLANIQKVYWIQSHNNNKCIKWRMITAVDFISRRTVLVLR